MGNLNLKGHTAIVTGAAQGIGKKISETFLQNEANVIAIDINKQRLEACSEEMNAAGYKSAYLSIAADVSDLSAINHSVTEGCRSFGGIDILVNNAGILHTTAMEDITEGEWDEMMNINLKSCFFFSQSVLPFMKEQNWGRIIHMSSLAGRMGGFTNGLGYSASKAGIIGLSRGMAYRLAKYNITVNCIAPGTTDSAILKQIPDEKIRGLIEMIPLGRLGKTTDIADLVLFLSSDMAEFITGSTIDINGGIYMG